MNLASNIGESLKNAGLNTLLGMGTVFTILILIMIVISLFKFVSKFEAMSAAKKAKKAAKNEDSVDNTIAQIVEKEEEELSDDCELVAVISAAIAAYEGTSANGYVVKSIRKSKGKNWQKATF